MQDWWIILCACGIFILLCIIQVIMKSRHPIRHAIGGILVGLCTLMVVNFTATFTGVSLPISPLTIGVSGVAGIPGVTLLLLLNLIMR